jgi:S1-C subfamily serine protease
MIRSLTAFALACLTAPVFAGSVGVAEPAQSKSARRCPEGHPETGDIGIEYLLCVGGSCSVNMRRDRGYVHNFSIEPQIRAIRPGSPSAGRLQDGDILIAVDGVLITTLEGGRRLANLKPGVPVTLRIRRNGREMDTTVVPELGCNMPRLAVLGASEAAGAATATAAWRAQAALLAEPPVDFGMELECGACGWYATPLGPQWRSREPPVIRSVELDGPAEQAGVQPGDVLLRLDGKLITVALAANQLAPGRPVTLQVRRGNALLDLEITPRKPGRQTKPF